MALKRNLVANYLGQGWVALMGIVFVPVYIRYLGIEAYGLIGIFAILLAWLALLDAGLNIPLAREMAGFTGGARPPADLRDLLRSIEVVAATAALVVAAAVHFGAEWLSTHWLRTEHLPPQQVALAFSWMGAVTALRILESVYRSCLLGLQRQVEYNLLNTSMATLRGAGAVAVLAWVSPTLEAFFAWQGLMSLVFLALLWLRARRALPPSPRPPAFSVAQLRSIGVFAGGTMTITFLGLLLTQTDKVLLSRLLSLAEYGYYTLASLVAGALYVLVSPVTQAWFPRLSQLHAAGDHVRLARTFHEGAQIVSVILGSAGIVLAAFSETFLLLWTGDPELSRQTWPVLSLLGLGTVLNGLMWMPHQAQLAHGWAGLGVRINGAAVVLIVPAILWATPRFGAIGAAWVWVLLNAGYVVVTAHFMHRKILRSEKLKWYANDLLLPLGAAALATALVRLAAPAPQGTFEMASTLFTATTASLFAAGLACSDLRRHALATLHRPGAP